MTQAIASTPPARRRRLSTFYVIIITQTLSLIGSRVSSLAFGIWIFTETGQATPLALTSFFTALPAVFAASLSGVLADRWDRRYVMAIADTGQAVGTALLLLSFTTGNFVLWHLYAVALFQAVFGVFQTPAFNASVTMLIPDDQRVRANAIRQLTAPSASVVAPLIATLVFTTIGLTGAILLDLFTFFVAVTVILRVYIPMPEQSAEGRAMRGSVWKEAWGGVRYLLDRRPLFYMIVYYALVNFFLTGATIFSIPYLLARTDNNEAALGILLAIINGGAVTGSLLIAYLNLKANRVRYIVICAVITGTMLALAGVSRSIWLLALTEFFVMLPIPIGNALFISILQAKVPPDVQGRVFAVMTQVVRLLMPLALLIAGPLADQILEPSLTIPQWGVNTPLNGQLFAPLFHAPGIDVFAPLVGQNAGAGMGLIMVVNGSILVLLALALNIRADVRTVETTLPDYKAIAKQDTPEA